MNPDSLERVAEGESPPEQVEEEETPPKQVEEAPLMMVEEAQFSVPEEQSP